MNPDFLSALVPAKINLFFEVLRRRSDGYHEIASLVTAVSLADSLYVRRKPARELDAAEAAEFLARPPSAFTDNNNIDENRLPVSSRSADGSLQFMVHIPSRRTFREMFAGVHIPADERNLVMKAARALQRVAVKKTHRLPSADIVLTKRIPCQAGLGGGSSDAAAALLLLDCLWDTRLSADELLALGSGLGCDVPLFLRPMPVICRGLGEELAEVPGKDALRPLHLVVLYPPVGLSTPDVYRACVPLEEETGRPADGSAASGQMTQLLAAWRENDLEALAAVLFNRLQPAARGITPWISRVESCFRSLPDPCVGFSMTGSGSAFFGLCRDKAHAKNVAGALGGYHMGWAFPVKSREGVRQGPGLF